MGGTTRVAGFMLAAATAVLLVIGTGPIAYIRKYPYFYVSVCDVVGHLIVFVAVMVVGALIFVLGIDLVKEALWDTRHRVSWLVHPTSFDVFVLTKVQDGVHHDRQHHDLHDRMGLRDWCHIRHCREL